MSLQNLGGYMNIEKVHKLAADIVMENQTKKIVTVFQTVTTQLLNVINQPQQPQHQTNFSASIKNLYALLDNSLVNKLSPAWYQLLRELEIDDVFGSVLRNKIENIISKNGITPASAKTELDLLFQKLNKTITALTQLTTGLKTLNIGLDELNGSECEIGILIPRSFINNNLSSLKDEIGEINFILNNFSEFITGKKEPYELRTLSTTDPLITVGAVMAIAAGFSKTVGFLIDNYKSLLEIKKLKMELSNQGLPDDNLLGIEEYCNKFMEEKIDEIKSVLELEYDVIKDKHRKNEVLNGIGISLNKISNRIDQGFNFEVRANIQTPSENTADKDSPELKQYNEILSASESMQFLKLDGAPILTLPEKTDDE
jgi:hypothetical protein